MGRPSMKGAWFFKREEILGILALILIIHIGRFFY